MRDSIKYTTIGIVSVLIGLGLWSWSDDGEKLYPVPALIFLGVGVIAICLAVVEAYCNPRQRDDDFENLP